MKWCVDLLIPTTRMAIFFVYLCLVSSTVHPETGQTGGDRGVQPFQSYYDQYLNAWNKGDYKQLRAWMNRFTLPISTFKPSDGHIETRAGQLKNLKELAATRKAPALIIIRREIHGVVMDDGTATVLITRVCRQNKPPASQEEKTYAFTSSDSWVKFPDGWKLQHQETLRVRTYLKGKEVPYVD